MLGKTNFPYAPVLPCLQLTPSRKHTPADLLSSIQLGPEVHNQ